MPLIHLNNAEPILLLHGGAGPLDPNTAAMDIASSALHEAALSGIQSKAQGLSLVLRCLEELEKNPLFNAGYGAALQADGKPRLSAAMMNGEHQSFSAVISVSDLMHPSRLAWALQDASSRVLAPPGTEVLARQLCLPVDKLLTEKRIKAWLEKQAPDCFSQDTVGCVYFDGHNLFAGTSTGGRGNEEAGRVSDAATVAGTYASKYLAISATGIGEEIVDDAVAARLETRVRDGKSLKEASELSYQEAIDKKRSYGWIAADKTGNISIAYSTSAMSFLAMELHGKIVSWSKS